MEKCLCLFTYTVILVYIVWSLHFIQVSVLYISYKYDNCTFHRSMITVHFIQVWALYVSYKHDHSTFHTSMITLHFIQTWALYISYKHEHCAVIFCMTSDLPFCFVFCRTLCLPAAKGINEPLVTPCMLNKLFLKYPLLLGIYDQTGLPVSTKEDREIRTNVVLTKWKLINSCDMNMLMMVWNHW